MGQSNPGERRMSPHRGPRENSESINKKLLPVLRAWVGDYWYYNVFPIINVNQVRPQLGTDMIIISQSQKTYFQRSLL
jgi:hypothetical protein